MDILGEIGNQFEAVYDLRSCCSTALDAKR